MLTRLMKTTAVGVWKMPSEPRPRQILPMTQTVQKTTEILQLQFPDHLIDVPLAFVVLVPQMQVVSETVEISQLDVVEKSAETPEIQTIHGTQTSESLSTAPVRQMAQSEVVEAIEIRVKTIDLECVKVHPAGLVKPDDPDTQIKFLAAETLHGIHGNRFAKELRRKDCVMGKMWKNKPSDEIARHCKHCTERGVMKTTRVWDSACRRYGSACLEDGRIDRSPLSDFLEDGQGSRQRVVPCISEQQVMV